MWFYGDTEARRAASHTRIDLRLRDSAPSRIKVAVDGFEAKRPEYSEWHVWSPRSKDEGDVECEDLVGARWHYLSTGIYPRVSCRGGPITALHVPIYTQHIFAIKA